MRDILASPEINAIATAALISTRLAQEGEWGELPLGRVLRLCVRHMSDGVALGTRAFVNEDTALRRELFGAKRKDRSGLAC